MSELNMTIQSGVTRVLHTAGKYCEGDIVIKAEGGDYGKGYESGVAQGEQNAYDAFWDKYQLNGTRTNYRYAFYSQGAGVWTDDTYAPKYPITATASYGGDSMYQASMITDTKVDVAIGANASYVFISCGNLKTIRKLIISDETAFNRWFGGCGALENVTFEGVIANDISFSDSTKLTNASVQSVIDHLKDLTGETAKTFTIHTYVGREVTEEQKAAITAKNWTLVY